MTYQIWRGAATSFYHSSQASEGYTFTMKKFNCIISTQLDNPSSSIESYLSDDNDKLDLQQTLIEESRQRCLNPKRSMQ